MGRQFSSLRGGATADDNVSSHQPSSSKLCPCLVRDCFGLKATNNSYKPNAIGASEKHHHRRGINGGAAVSVASFDRLSHQQRAASKRTSSSASSCCCKAATAGANHHQLSNDIGMSNAQQQQNDSSSTSTASSASFLLNTDKIPPANTVSPSHDAKAGGEPRVIPASEKEQPVIQQDHPSSNNVADERTSSTHSSIDRGNEAIDSSKENASSSSSTVTPPLSSPLIEHFRHLVRRETDELNQLIEDWNLVLHADQSSPACPPIEVCDEVRAAIGKTRLIITQRFTQFLRLVDQADGKPVTGKLADRPVYEQDLEGFWEMDYIQVKNVRDSFDKLANRRDNNWKEIPASPKPASSSTSQLNGRKPAKKPTKKKTNVLTPEMVERRRAAQIERRKAMQALRQKKKQQELQQEEEKHEEVVTTQPKTTQQKQQNDNELLIEKKDDFSFNTPHITYKPADPINIQPIVG